MQEPHMTSFEFLKYQKKIMLTLFTILFAEKYNICI